MYEAVKKIILVDLPTLDTILKVPLTLVIVALTGFFVIALWRDPTRVSELDPETATRLKQGTISFFQNSGDFAPVPAIVFGNAKDIVRQMKTTSNVFSNIDAEIEARKRRDNNWKFANELSAGKALVNALGLDFDTKRENHIFLQMPLPNFNKEKPDTE